ncbi:unnamed protein product [Lasius platythorax]|uniref:Uncharacterized protein n=1 Tax=Lasius platythorax TaxID=488582 RepID=A0AAV2MWY0_9HYME
MIRRFATMPKKLIQLFDRVREAYSSAPDLDEPEMPQPAPNLVGTARSIENFVIVGTLRSKHEILSLVA